MKRVVASAIGLGVLAGLVACGSSSSSTTTPSPAPIMFTATILPANELGAIQGGETSGSGTVTITFNVTKDSAGAITSATAAFQCNLTGFPSTTNVTLAHIHVGSSSQNGGIVVNTGLASGDAPLTNGAGSFSKQNVTVDAALAQQIADNPSGYYFNVHTSANPGGVARAQLNRIQ
jgi:hypothetical protein